MDRFTGRTHVSDAPIRLTTATVQEIADEAMVSLDPLDTLRSWWEQADQEAAENGDLVVYRDSYDHSYKVFTVDDADRTWRNPKVYRVLRRAPDRHRKARA